LIPFVFQALKKDIDFLGAESNPVLVVKHRPFGERAPISDVLAHLWRTVDLSHVDEHHIDAQLEQDGEIVERKFKRTGKWTKKTNQPKPKETSGEEVPPTVRHIKNNAHVIQDLQDYSVGKEKAGTSKSKRRRQSEPAGPTKENGDGGMEEVDINDVGYS